MTGVLTGDIRSNGICFNPTAQRGKTNEVAVRGSLPFGVQYAKKKKGKGEDQTQALFLSSAGA